MIYRAIKETDYEKRNMESNELRINNIISINDKNCIVKGINTDGFLQCKWNDSDTIVWGEPLTCFDPIQLTEEWLVKLGFNYGGIWIELMGLMSCGRILQHKGIGAKSTAFYINEQFIANIQYLHELQNLYFALTGTELKTK